MSAVDGCEKDDVVMHVEHISSHLTELLWYYYDFSRFSVEGKDKFF